MSKAITLSRTVTWFNKTGWNDIIYTYKLEGRDKICKSI